MSISAPTTWQDFADAWNNPADKAKFDQIKPTLDALGIHPNTVGGPTNNPPSDEIGGDLPEPIQAQEVVPPGNKPNPATGSEPGNFEKDVPSSLNSPEQTQKMAENLVNAFMEKGLTKNQAIGVVASLMQESGLNTAIKQGGAFSTEPSLAGDVVNQSGYGLAQWGESRLQDMMNYADQHGLPRSSQAAQAGFMLEEAEKMGVLDQIKNGPDNASAACSTWTSAYEKAAEPNMDTRLGYISQIENWVG